MLETIQYELKKLLYKRKGLVFLLLFTGLKLLSLLLFDTPVNQQMEIEKSSYRQQLEFLSGPLTKNNHTWFSETSASIAKAESIVQITYAQYYAGELTEDELHRTVDPMLTLLESRNGFNLAYQQFLYVRQNPENRYFLYTNGWDALLSFEQLDYLLILTLFLILTPIHCEESKNQMDLLTITMRRGGNTLSLCKMITALILIVALSAGTFFIEVGFCAIKYGLPNGSFPLQSLTYFSSSSKTIALSQAVLFVYGVKTLGYLCLGCLILFTSVLFKKYAPALLTCVVFSLFPILGLSESLRYFIPGPAALMTAIGFLKGTEMETIDPALNQTVSFQEVSSENFLFLLMITLGLSMLFLLIIQHRMTNQWKKTSFRFKKILSLLALASILSLASGCSPSTETTKTFNLFSAQYYETDRYFVYQEYDEDFNSRFIVEDKESGEQTPLLKDPFFNTNHVMNYIYGQGDFVYTVQMTSENSESVMYVMYDQLLVQEINLTDFSERTIFRCDLNEKNLLGETFAANREDLTFYLESIGFFIDDSYLYFISSNSISRVHRITGKREKLIETLVITDVAYDGKHLYYLNEKSELVQYNISEKTSYILTEVVAKRFYFHDYLFYFINRKEQNSLFLWNRATATVHKLRDGDALWLVGDYQYLFFYDNETNQIHRIDADGRNEIPVLSSSNRFTAYLFSQAERLYLPSLEDGEKLILDENTLQEIQP